MLFLVESFYSVAGRIVGTELRLVFGLVELGFIVPHFSFYDVHWKKRKTRSVQWTRDGLEAMFKPSSIASEVASRSRPLTLLTWTVIDISSIRKQS